LLDLKLRKLGEEAGAALAAAETLEELNGIRIRFLGKKGEVTQVLRGMGSLSAEERPRIGQVANEVRASIEKELADRTALLKNRLKEQKLREEDIDVTLPGTPVPGGGKHPLNLVLEEIEDIFLGLGYSIARDENSILTVTGLIDGLYGIKDCCLSLPAVINAGGRGRPLELPLAEEERKALLESAAIIKNAINELGL
jgi:phenylalanyl-tRNA synthetase alpha subunit